MIRLREGETPSIPDDKRILTHARQLSLVAEWIPGSHRKTFSLDHLKPEASVRIDPEYSDIPRALEAAFLEDRNVPKAGFYVKGDWSPVIDLIQRIPHLHDSLVSDINWGSDVCPTWFIRDYMINCAMSESFVKKFFTQIRTSQENLVQLVMSPLHGEWAQYSKLDQYSCFPPGVKKFITSSIFDRLASVWTVKQDNYTELNAICEKPFDFASLDKKYPEGILSIFRSTGIWETRPDVKT
ncbi:hypothetical protein N7504_010808 [Penicillium tannophilum]|nr:hypothetical protein N7504_010808 [Penicillium tannophilum]